MTAPLVVRPARYQQFGHTERPFRLVTSAALAGHFVIDGPGDVVTLDAARGLGGTLTAEVPADADVLVSAPGTFLGPLAEAELAQRRVLIVPCGSTPVTADSLRAILPVLEQADVAAQERRADEFFAALEESAAVTVTDSLRSASCDFSLVDCEGEWHQQAGPLSPGEQQIAPAGELSVLAGGIATFDSGRTLPLSGEIVLRGPVIVHAGYDAALAAEQDEVYQRLAVLYRAPVVLGIEGGRIMSCRPGDDSADAKQVTAEIDGLLESDDGYRTVWEVGFGINSELSLLPGNCGLNEVFGGRHGVLHLGLGLTPGTRFALTFLCPDSLVRAGNGVRLAGNPGGRLTRTRSASCGCH